MVTGRCDLQQSTQSITKSSNLVPIGPIVGSHWTFWSLSTHKQNKNRFATVTWIFKILRPLIRVATQATCPSSSSFPPASSATWYPAPSTCNCYSSQGPTVLLVQVQIKEYHPAEKKSPNPFQSILPFLSSLAVQELGCQMYKSTTNLDKCVPCKCQRFSLLGTVHLLSAGTNFDMTLRSNAPIIFHMPDKVSTFSRQMCLYPQGLCINLVGLQG